MQLLVHLGAITHGLADFALDDFAKATAEAVNGDLDRTLVHIEPGGDLGLGEVFGVTAQPRLERLEMVGLPGGLMFLSKCRKGAVEQGERPFAVVLAVGTGSIWVGKL